MHRQTIKKVDEVILTEFIVAIKRGILITEMTESCLLSLAPWFRGLGVPIFEELCKIEYKNSIMISDHFAMALLINSEDTNQILNWIITRSK